MCKGRKRTPKRCMRRSWFWGLMAVTVMTLGVGTFSVFAGEEYIDVAMSKDGVLVDGAPAGEDSQQPVYVAHDIVYYEDLDSYESGLPYGEGEASDRHTQAEADANTVVHITKPGTYRLSGSLHGQVAVDLGDEAKRDESAVVTLLFDGADIFCDVAPGVIFYKVFECDTAWTAYDEEEIEEYTASPVIETSGAGARVILADGSVNTVRGSHVARIYKDEEGQKKKAKYDGAFYSKMTMRMEGEEEGTGVLNIIGDREGLNSELHLSINGGKVNIESQDDGINTNEDLVSVTEISGGELHVLGGLGESGDGIDSNGYLVIKGGTLICSANPAADCGLDSDLGTFIHGGVVVSVGSVKYWADPGCEQATMNLQFASMQEPDEAIVVTDQEGKVVFAYDPDKDETTAENTRPYQGVVISCPEFAEGESYFCYLGGQIEGEESNGIYDAQTVKGYEEGIRQTWQGSLIGLDSLEGEEAQENDAAEVLSVFTLKEKVNAFASLKDEE